MHTQGHPPFPFWRGWDSGAGRTLAFRWAICHFAPGKLWALLNQIFISAVFFCLDPKQRNGCVQAGWQRWQLPAESGLHWQMENDGELLPTRTHLPHHLCFEGAQLCAKPKTWQLGLIPEVSPKAVPSKYPRNVSVQLQIRPQILGVIHHMELGVLKTLNHMQVSNHFYRCGSSLQAYRGSWLILWWKEDRDSPRIPRPCLGSLGKIQFFRGQSECEMGTVMVGGWKEWSGFWRGHRCFGGSRVGRRVEPGPFSCRWEGKVLTSS